MSKIKKIILCLFCVSFLIISCLTANAQTITSGDTVIKCSNDKNLSFDISNVDFIVSRNGVSYDGGSVSISTITQGVNLRLNLTSDIGTLKIGDIVDVVVTLKPKGNALKDSSLNVKGYMRTSVFGSACSVDSSSIMGYRDETSSGLSQSASVRQESVDDAIYCYYVFNENSFGCTFDEYSLILSYTVKSTSSSNKYVYLSGFNFTTSTKEELAAQQIIENQDKNTDKIVQNQDENTQAIIDNEKELQEQEKQEASDTGDDGVNEMSSAIPNDSDGFVDSLGNLVNAMSYTGTDCNWELPSVSIPAIDGVMPEIKLWDKKEIPFEYWISQIPSGIMTLVRSLLTIGLIIYCFKEMYSVISYVLTLKGGGASE